MTIDPPILCISIGCAGIGADGTPFEASWLFGKPKNSAGDFITYDGNTPFQLASVSKTFTATLYQTNLRSQNANLTLGSYIGPNSPLPISPRLSNITLDSLMSYSSGLPADNMTDRVDTPYPLPTPSYTWPEMFTYLDNNKLGMQPGYQYSNLGFALMAAVLSGNPADPAAFASSMQTTIFDTLGMTGTMFFGDLDLSTLPQTYNFKPLPGYTSAGPGWPLFPAYYGAGGLVASSNDMMTWLKFNMGLQQTSLSPALAETQIPQSNVLAWNTTNLGLGWFLNIEPEAGVTSVWKDGGFDGCNTYIAFLPSSNPGTVPSQAGVYVLMNVNGFYIDRTELPCVLANDILLNMQGLSSASDKSVYPSSTRRDATASQPT